YFPHTVFLPAFAFRICVCGSELIIAAEVELVGIVRNQHLLSTNQFVIKSILRAGEHEELVEQFEATHAAYRRVVVELRGQFHAALTWCVAPRSARLRCRVKEVHHAGQFASLARWR